MTPKKPTAREAATEALSRLPKAEWTSGDSAFIRGFLEGWKAGAAIQRERDAEIAEQRAREENAAAGRAAIAKREGVMDCRDAGTEVAQEIAKAIRAQGDEK